MQCHLEPNELNVLADILLEQPDRRDCNALLDKVLARDLRFDTDELDLAAELLAAKRQSLQHAIASQPDPMLKRNLQQTLARLEHVMEKVDEACAMF